MINKFPTLNKEVKEIAMDVANGTKSMKDFDNAVSISSKSTSTFGKSLKSLGANLLSIGINAGLMWGVSKAIGAVVTTVIEMAQYQTSE